MSALKVIPKLCTGCEICGIICSMVHYEQVRETGMRIKIKHRYPELKSPVFQPQVCRNCDDPKCVEACPQNALVLDEKAGEVRIIESDCDGCGQCVEICPFDAIWVDPVSGKAIKCDLCNGDPQCVKYCNFDAIRYTELSAE
jgi:carbon-monoxide dehydrogenase iron sulfur subunit